MSILPKEHDPFSKSKIYEILKIDPKTENNKLEKKLEKTSIETLASKDAEMGAEQIKGSINLLKRNFSRVLINALLPDKVDIKMVEQQLKNLPDVNMGEIKLPEVNLSEVFIEGKNLEVSETDFNLVEEEPNLELDFEALNKHMIPKKIENYHYFET